MNEENVLIGSGDDLVEHWEEPFRSPISSIGNFMLEAESFGFDIEWEQALRDESEIRELLEDRYIERLDDIVEAMSPEILTTYEQWGGGAPGHSGTVIHMFVSQPGKDLVLGRLGSHRAALERYWEETGYAEDARRQMEKIDEEISAKRAAVEEQREEEASGIARAQLTKLDSLIHQVQEHFREEQDSFLHMDNMLITPTKQIFVIVDNPTYGIDDSWALIAERLEQLNYQVTQLVESYSSDHGRIPHFAGDKRSTVRGWLQTESLLLGPDRKIDEEADSWRQQLIESTA